MFFSTIILHVDVHGFFVDMFSCSPIVAIDDYHLKTVITIGLDRLMLDGYMKGYDDEGRVEKSVRGGGLRGLMAYSGPKGWGGEGAELCIRDGDSVTRVDSVNNVSIYVTYGTVSLFIELSSFNKCHKKVDEKELIETIKHTSTYNELNDFFKRSINIVDISYVVSVLYVELKRSFINNTSNISKFSSKQQYIYALLDLDNLFYFILLIFSPAFKTFLTSCSGMRKERITSKSLNICVYKLINLNKFVYTSSLNIFLELWLYRKYCCLYNSIDLLFTTNSVYLSRTCDNTEQNNNKYSLRVKNKHVFSSLHNSMYRHTFFYVPSSFSLIEYSLGFYCISCKTILINSLHVKKDSLLYEFVGRIRVVSLGIRSFGSFVVFCRFSYFCYLVVYCEDYILVTRCSYMYRPLLVEDEIVGDVSRA